MKERESGDRKYAQRNNQQKEGPNDDDILYEGAVSQQKSEEETRRMLSTKIKVRQYDTRKTVKQGDNGRHKAQRTEKAESEMK